MIPTLCPFELCFFEHSKSQYPRLPVGPWFLLFGWCRPWKLCPRPKGMIRLVNIKKAQGNDSSLRMVSTMETLRICVPLSPASCSTLAYRKVSPREKRIGRLGGVSEQAPCTRIQVPPFEGDKYQKGDPDFGCLGRDVARWFWRGTKTANSGMVYLCTLRGCPFKPTAKKGCPFFGMATVIPGLGVTAEKPG